MVQARQGLYGPDDFDVLCSMSVQAKEFLDAVKPFVEDYEAIEVRLIAFKWRGHWINLSTRAALGMSLPRRQKLPLPAGKIPGLMIKRVLLPVTDLERILDIFETGELRLGKTKVSFQSIDHSGFTSSYSPSFWSYSRHQSKQFLNIDARCFVLSGGDSTVQSSIGTKGFELLESKLASLDAPFDGMRDLVLTHTGLLRFKGAWSNSTLDVVVPVDIRFESSSTLEEESVIVRTSIRKGHKVDQTSVGVIERKGGNVLRRRRKPLSLGPKLAKDRLLLETEVRVASQADSVLLLLSYKGDMVDRKELFRNRIEGQNPRMSVVASIDPDLRAFGEELRGKGRKPGKGFERAVVTLLSFLGFSCLHVGAGSEANPDIFAWGHDPSVVYVVECTIAEPDLRNKITKFAARLRHIRTVSPITRAIGVLITTLSHAQINPADLERAKMDKIIIVDAESLESLLELAQNGAGVGEALHLLDELGIRQQVSFDDFVT